MFPVLATVVSHLFISLLPCTNGSGRPALEMAPAPQRVQAMAAGQWEVNVTPGYYRIVGTTPNCHIHWRAVALPGKTRHVTLRLLNGKDGPNFTEEMWYSAAGTLPLRVARAELDPLDAPIRSRFSVQLENDAWYTDIVARGRYILRLMTANGSVIASIGVPSARTTFGGYVLRNVTSSEIKNAVAGRAPFNEPSVIVSDKTGKLWFLNRPASTIVQYDESSGFHTFHLDVRAQPSDIAASEDGSIWFTEIFGNAIGHFVGDELSIYPVGDGPWGPRMPRSVTVGAHGVAFFTEANSRAFGAAYPDGSIREVQNVSDVYNVVGGENGLPTEPLGVASISPAPEGGMWFGTGNWYGSFLTGAPLRRYASSSFIWDVGALSDGAWLFNENIMRVNLDGKVVQSISNIKPKCPCWHQLHVVDARGVPCVLTDLSAACVRAGKAVQYDGTAIPGVATRWTPKLAWPHAGDMHATIDRQDTIWWTVPYQNLVMHLTNDGKIGATRLPTPDAGPTGITTTPHGVIWVVETWAQKLAKIDSRTMQVVKEIPIP